MKLPGLLAALALVACTGTDVRDADVADQAVRDFIAVRGLEQQDKMRSSDSSGWQKITDRYIIYSSRREQYLVEFARPCYELDDNSRIIADRRYDAGTIQARFETIRGCRIATIYPLSEAEAGELANIGESPGARN